VVLEIQFLASEKSSSSVAAVARRQAHGVFA